MIIRLQGLCAGIVLVALLCSLFSQTGTAYHPAGTFSISHIEWPVEIIPCGNGGFAIAGTAFIAHYCFLLIKTDRFGGLDWIHTYRTDEHALCNGLTGCADGGFVLVGQLLHDRGWIVRTDSYGATLWNLTVTEEDTSEAELTDVIELSNGNVLAAGFIRSTLLNHTDAWLVNVDENGTVIWSKTYGKEYQHQLCKSLILCDNGDLLLVGDTANSAYGLQDFWMLRTTGSGTRLWQKTFHLAGNEDFHSAIETYDGGFVLTGSWEDGWIGHWDLRMFLLRTDSMGNLMWNRTYSGSKEHVGVNEFHSAEITAGRDVVECGDKGFAILGATNSFANYFPKNIWLVRTDEYGSPIWNYTMTTDSSDSPVSMTRLGNTSFAVVAETRESLISYEHDIFFTTLYDEAPYTPSTTTTTQGTHDILMEAAVVIGGIGAGAVFALVIYHIYKRRSASS